MFRAALLFSLASVALGLSVSNLKVTVKAISLSVDSIDDIVITAVVSNPTDQDIRILAVNNILDTSPTQSFVVTKGSEDVLFSGVRATYDFSSDALYKTIPAHSSIAVNHTRLAALYGFESAGTGTFTFVPNTRFQSAFDTTPVVVNAPTVSVQVKHDVKKRELVPLQARTTTPSCADPSRNQFIADALADARARAGGAATDILSHPTSTEFNTYFSGNSDSDIWFRFDIIAGDLPTSGTRIIGCTDPANICPGNSVIAYTLLSLSGSTIVSSDIYTCDIFFTDVAPTSSICGGSYDSTTSSTGGVILHELSHATSDTADIVYGCSAAAQLSPADKINNADNYRCMGLAIFQHYNC